MRSFILVIGLIVVATAGSAMPVSPAAASEVCFQKGEQRSGMNKICFYRCLSGDAAITVGGLEFCPLTLNR